MKVLTGAQEILASNGSELGVSDWIVLTQKEIDLFAEATGDHQWIHVDVERARTSSFGSTIAHGFLTLSLLPRLQAEVFRFDGFGFGVNYGLNRIRFPAPVPVDSRLRARIRLADVTQVQGGLQVTTENVIEVEGVDKPACVADFVVRLLD